MAEVVWDVGNSVWVGSEAPWPMEKKKSRKKNKDDDDDDAAAADKREREREWELRAKVCFFPRDPMKQRASR